MTLQDKEMVYRLKIELEQMKAFDEKKHFTALLDAKKSQILKLEKGIIPKEIFEGVNTSKQDYLYENGEYTIRLKGKNTYTPADMKAEIEKKQEKDSLSFTVKAEGALPGEVELSIKCTMKDGIYMLYELQDGVWREAQWTGISNGFMKCDVSKGGSYLLKKAELGDSEQEKSDEEEKQQEKENTVSGTKSTTKTSSGSTGRSGASSAFSQSKPSSNTIKAEVKNGIVEKKTFEDIKGKDKNLKIEGEAAKDKPYRIIINGKDVKKAEDMKAGIKEGSPYEKEIKMLADSPYIFHFEEAGAFPGQVKVEMSVDKADGAYLLLHYDEKEQKAEYIQKVEIKDKKTQFLVSEGGTYFIDKKAKTKSIKELLAEEKEQQKSLKEKEKKNAVLSDEAEEEEFLAGTADTEKSSPLKTAAAALFVTAAGAVGGFLYYRKKRK